MQLQGFQSVLCTTNFIINLEAGGMVKKLTFILSVHLVVTGVLARLCIGQKHHVPCSKCSAIVEVDLTVNFS